MVAPTPFTGDKPYSGHLLLVTGHVQQQDDLLVEYLIHVFIFTTIVKTVYRRSNESLLGLRCPSAEYGIHIFQPVSSSPDVERICLRLLEKFNKNVAAFANQGDAINELASCLSGRTEKMLIVLDGVRTVDKGMRMLVDAIKKAAHSKILITSRAKLKVCDSSHSMSLLSKDNARKLFERNAFNGDRERTWKPDKQLIDQVYFASTCCG